MNKKILAVSVLMLIMCAMAASVFAGEDTEYQYTVEVSYRTASGNLQKVTYTLWASSAADAREQAIALCQYEKGEVASCGAAKATGRTR